MPHLTFTPEANEGILRCRRFLEVKSVAAARRAQERIKKGFEYICQHPFSGNYFSKNKILREWSISFNKYSSYMFLYAFDEEKDEVLIVSFRHSRELAYKLPENFLDDEEE